LSKKRNAIVVNGRGTCFLNDFRRKKLIIFVGKVEILDRLVEVRGAAVSVILHLRETSLEKSFLKSGEKKFEEKNWNFFFFKNDQILKRN